MDYRDAHQFRGQAKVLARVFYKKFRAVLASRTVEDYEQEVWLCWTLCCKGYNPDSDATFLTYLNTSIWRRLSAIADSERRHCPRVDISLEDIRPGADTPVGETVASPDYEPIEDALARRELSERVLAKMDPRLRLIFQIQNDLPDEWREILEGLKAKAAYADQLGIKLTAPKSIPLDMLTDFIGLHRSSRYRLLEDIREELENA